MPYVLCRMVIGREPRIRITQSEYEAIKAARSAVGEITSAEEKFDAVMENYVELEQSLLTSAVRHLAFSIGKYEEFVAPRNEISRRIANVLASAKLYRDAIPQHAKRALGKTDTECQRFVAELDDEARTPLAFRVGEAIRNFSQHEDLPLEGITYNSRREDVDESGRKAHRFAFRVSVTMNCLRVARRRGLKKDVQERLEILGDKADPLPLIREHIECIGAMQVSFRQAVQIGTARREELLQKSINRYIKRSSNKKPFGIAAAFEHSDKRRSEVEYIIQDQLDYLEYLRRKNRTTINLAKRYVRW